MSDQDEKNEKIIPHFDPWGNWTGRTHGIDIWLYDEIVDAILDKGELIEQSNMKKLLLKAKHQVLIIESIDKLPENIYIENCNCEILDDYTLQLFQGESTSISDVVLELSAQNNMGRARSTTEH